MIRIGNQKWQYLREPIFANGKRVMEVWTDGVKVYPENPEAVAYLNTSSRVRYPDGGNTDRFKGDVFGGIKSLSEDAPGGTRYKVSTTESPMPVYIYSRDPGYLYTDADIIYLNSDSSGLFSGFKEVDDQGTMYRLDCTYLRNADRMFRYVIIDNIDGLRYWDMSGVTSMSEMFAFGLQISLGEDRYHFDFSALAGWDTSNVTNMYRIFYCSPTYDLDFLSGWNVSSVTTLEGAFSSTGKIFSKTALDISGLGNWDVSSVTNMANIFQYTYLDALEPISGWNTSNVTSMYAMFNYKFLLLNSLDALAGWDVSSVTSFGNFAYGNYERAAGLNAKIDASSLSAWDVSSGTNFTSIFGAAGTKAKNAWIFPNWNGRWDEDRGTFIPN